MTSKFRDQTESTQPLSLGENIGVLAQPSKQLASSDNTLNSTQTSQKPSKGMLSGVTTGEITEKTRQHAMIAKVVLSQLLKAGLVKRFKVLSPDGTTVKEFQIVLDPALWTEDLELR